MAKTNRYRIIRRTDIYLEESSPRRCGWFVIQKRIVTCLLFCIPFWRDMKFNDYAESIMSFNNLEETINYLNKLEELERKQ